MLMAVCSITSARKTTEHVPDDPEAIAVTEMIIEDSVNMISLMNILQSPGVDVVAANRFAASVVLQTPSLVELYGRGISAECANRQRRNLNILGEAALDIRNLKPIGQPCCFSPR